MADAPGPDPERWHAAIVHDSFTQWGGAERVVASLHRLLPHAPIYTIAVDYALIPEDMRRAEFRPSFLQGWPGMPGLSAYRRYLPLLPIAAASLRPEGYDLVISSSSSFAHGAKVPPEVHVAYIHNTMRFAWDYDDYVAQFGWPRPIKWTGRLAAGPLRAWDAAAGRRPMYLLANSSAVSARIARRWRRTAEVLPPPVRVDQVPLGGPRRRHFSVVTRLQPYKRVDLAVAAAACAREPLLVVGDGPDLPRLRAMAGPTVTFLGRIDEAAKWRVLAESFALLVPGVEDFGIAAVEANAAGTPVVGAAGGGVLDSQRAGVTALLVDPCTPETLAAAMRQARQGSWDHRAIRQYAQRFSEEAFHRRLTAMLSRLPSSECWSTAGGDAA